MSEGVAHLPRPLALGLRGLRTIPSCEVVAEPTFHAAVRQWAVQIVLYISKDSAFVAHSTPWYVLIDKEYPFGEIAVFPSKDGLAATFPHQSRNCPPEAGLEWRTGKLCLDTPFRSERLTRETMDPIGEAGERLKWHVRRALAWLEAASAEELLRPGDPFELPQLPQRIVLPGVRRIVHDEPPSGLEIWQGFKGSWGEARLGMIPELKGINAVSSFKGADGHVVRHWIGRHLDESPEDLLHAYWWLWPAPIVTRPWHAPGTWGDLRTVGRAQNIDVDDVLESLAFRVRNSKKRTVLFVGYPIPSRVGEPAVEVHWDAIGLPKLRSERGKPAPGHRNNRLGWWERDRQGELGNNAPIEYLYMENWHPSRLQARGRLPEPIRDSHFAIVGVGALGSAVAELLARTGCKRITLVDPDLLGAGNICRHIGTLNDIGQFKSKVVAQRLLQVSPVIEVATLEDEVPLQPQEVGDLLQEATVIIDCTASDEVLQSLAGAWWSMPKLFISLSLGYAARRLFAFGHFGHQFPLQNFEEMMGPWLASETGEWSESGELLEGAGCWSPLFPARYDDVVMAASVCIKEIETLIVRPPSQPVLRVFEQKNTEQMFSGFALSQRPPSEDDHEVQ